jgi:hypothetical protein
MNILNCWNGSAWDTTQNTFSKPVMNDSRICRPYGANDFWRAVATKMSLLTELGLTGKTSGPSLYHLLQVLGKEHVMARIEKALKMI